MAPPGGPVRLDRASDHWVGRFRAMASPCEVLLQGSCAEAERALAVAAAEAARVERKFSRYLPEGVVHAINASAGRPVEVDEETARLLDFAAEVHRLSGGSFDVTSGVYRRVWSFDGSDRVPTRAAVRSVAGHVGWQRIAWDGRTIVLPPGMEIDLGAVGKEYAVDRAVELIVAEGIGGALVNFGGDLATTGPRPDGTPWRVGILDPRAEGLAERVLQLVDGGLATSGDASRYVQRGRRRYGHILDARTGWPVPGTPRSVTVAADRCTEAGMLATLAMLEGRDAERFLEAQGRPSWVLR